MDFDSFDDDLADEDLLTALDQVSSSNGGRAPRQSGTFHDSKAIGQRETAAELLDNLPSDAFSSPEAQPAPKQRKVDGFASRTATRNGAPVLSLPSSSSQRGFRQTTLWGDDATIDEIQLRQQSQPSNGHGHGKRTLHASRPHEEPTQHEIDRKAMETWVYPTNLGAIRDYQYSIVKNSLFNNTLVALPTGLGKTFIAATVMLNFYRWTTRAKIIFVAPTKPLVSQQIDACFHIAGIPRSDTTLLTGDVAPALRADEWERRRVFFMTPQTLVNDLSHGYADPKSIALIVIDEAHRATGEYAYAKAAKMIRRFSKSFRVLALTATPGSKVETVQEVIDNLGISHCEIRTEESIDIRQYVHNRDIDQVVLDPSDEINLIGELFTEALKPLTEKLSAQNIWYGRNPMALTTYGLILAQKEWFSTRGQHANSGLQFMMRAIFSALTSLAHSIKLLQFHGIGPFYDNMVDFRGEQESKGDKGSKYKQQVVQSTSFQEMMDRMAGWIKQDGFVGHPKLTALAEAVLNHFMDAGEASRVIVFSEYRDSADTIVRMLNSHRPLIKATTFVGQADGKRGEGMTQKQQIETIERFKKGEHNVLVATSIGEEGLDIGQVDLIVCYDASASPIRMLQRMGRTGRKRAGKIVLLLMRGKEEEQYAKSKDNYEKMQKLICEGSRFNFRFDLSTRIVPREIRPEVDKRHVEIPVENTQDVSLPEPRKRLRAPVGHKKKPPKKFHMPDGVETGFHTVAEMLRPNRGKGQAKAKAAAKKPTREVDDVVAIPALERVVLGEDELRELNRSYRDLPFNNDVVEETELPDMTAHPEAQRTLGPVVGFQHGTHTRRCVGVLGKMGTEPESLLRPCRRVDTSNYLAIPVKPFGGDTESDTPGPTRKRQVDGEGPQTKKRKTTTTTSNTKTAPKPVPQKAFKKPATFAFHNSSEAEETDDDGSEHEAQAEVEDGVTIISIEKWKQKKKHNSRGKGKGTDKDKSREHNLYSDELGDDCERDSDLLLDMADSDNGSDLLDFVVRDSQLTSSARRLGTSSPAVPRHYRTRGEFTPTPESEGSLEDVAALMESAGAREGKRKRGGDRDVDGDVYGDGRARRARGRRAVVDSESDE